MSDSQTPVEGKGDEMIPERGLPFTEELEEEIAPMPELDALPAETIDDILEQVPAEITGETPLPAQDLPPETAEEAPPLMEAPPTETLAPEVPPAEMPPLESSLMDLEEIRLREQELAEDFHAPPPDFEGETDAEFATARVAVPLPGPDREAIMLESGAGIIRQDEIPSASEPEEAEEFEDVPSPLPIESPPAGTTIQSSTTTLSVSTPEKETHIVREEALIRADTLELPGPSTSQKESQAPALVKDLKATKKLLELLVPNSRVEDLWERADKLQQQIFHEIDDLPTAQELLEQVRSAKNLMLADKANFEEAERALNEVEYRIVYGKRFKKWSFLGYLLLFYEVAFGAGASLVIYLLLRAGETGLNLSVNGILSSSEVFIGILAALFGCIGGVAGALFALWRYMTEQKFNPQFSIWYITQPIIGLTIGAGILFPGGGT